MSVVLSHSRGKATSVLDLADDRPVLGVDTEVVIDGELLGKPADATEAESMLELLEDRPALWGDRGEEQRRRRRDAHAVLRARQISSHGQRRAHSGSNA